MVLETLGSWVADPACAGNAMTLTVAGIIYTNEGNYVEALKACHTGLSLEMCVCTARQLLAWTHNLLDWDKYILQLNDAIEAVIDEDMGCMQDGHLCAVLPQD